MLGIIAGILVARHLKTTEDLHDSRPSPRTESLLAWPFHFEGQFLVMALILSLTCYAA